MFNNNFLLLSSFLFCVTATEAKSTNVISKTMLNKLYKCSKMIHSEVSDIDWKNDKVYIKEYKSLIDDDIETLKKKSFIDPPIKVKKLDFDNDILYYDDE